MDPHLRLGHSADFLQLSVLPGGKLLYRGKVIDNRQDAKGGWTIGTTILEPLLDDESATQAPSKQEHMVLRYQVFRNCLLITHLTDQD